MNLGRQRPFWCDFKEGFFQGITRECRNFSKAFILEYFSVSNNLCQRVFSVFSSLRELQHHVCLHARELQHHVCLHARDSDILRARQGLGGPCSRRSCRPCLDMRSTKECVCNWTSRGRMRASSRTLMFIHLQCEEGANNGFPEQRGLTLFHADFGKEFPSRMPLSKLCAVPFALQNRAPFQGGKGRKGAEKRGGRGVGRGAKRKKDV